MDKLPPFDEDKVRTDLEAVCTTRVNHFIYYKGKKHVANIPIYPKALKQEAIISRVKSLHPEDNVIVDDIDYELATPIARFDNAVIEQNNGIDFQFELKQFENQIEVMVYGGEPEKACIHYNLKQALLLADDEIKIESEFQNSQFNLVAFSSKYIGHLAYAFIGHNESIFGCMLKKDIRGVAEVYMDDVQYKQWFGAKFSVV